jgi:murein DD-endopeptidase MepM/ murein hydrolase activator NlpD
MHPCEDKGGYRSFGWKTKNGLFHTGHDYNVPVGTDIVSRWDGEVVFSGYVSGFGSYGKEGGVIVIRHKYQKRTLYGIYGHIVRYKSAGEKVKEGEIIGKVIKYQTKEWRADHLHHGIWDNEMWELPRKWGYVPYLQNYKNPLDYV